MKYDLKSDFNLLSFLKTVDQCTGEVLLESEKGTQLNLKSQLCKVLLLTRKPGDAALLDCRIECSEEDGERLSAFLVIPE